MKRTTIMIPNELKTLATRHAKKIGMSLGGFIRESLEKAMEVENHRSGKDDEDPFFSDETVFSGKSPSDLSANHDDYLYESNEVQTLHGTGP
jgi:hypothetical protein